MAIIDRWLNTLSNDQQLIDSWKKKASIQEDLLKNKETTHTKQYFSDYKIPKPSYSIFSLGHNQFNLNYVFSGDKFERSFIGYEGDKFTELVIEGISLHEDGLTATVELSGPNKLKLFSFASDYFLSSERYEKFQIKTKVKLYGWALSLSHQDSPPKIKQKNGKLITTAGSSILLPKHSKNIDEYVYQFNVHNVEEISFENSISIYSFSTWLASFSEMNIPLQLFASERVVQGAYSPKNGDDVFGMMILCCNLA
ncbi:MAG: hypothetical protein ACFFD1_01885 [Candidatus Thorarchaeota archaeon]